MDANSVRPVLESRRAGLVEEWLAEALKSYPDQTAQFLENVADRFRNPVGHLLRENLAAVFDAVFVSDDWASAARALRDLVQLRAVQHLTVDEAVGFVATIGPIVRRVLPTSDPGAACDLDARLDRLTALARGLHREWRERIEQVRSNDIWRRTSAVQRLRVPRPTLQARGNP